MTKIQTSQAIAQELNKLNQIIDQKIIKGEPYRREAIRHKTLLSNLARISQSGWLTRAMATFMF